jgi:altronate dehydratase
MSASAAMLDASDNVATLLAPVQPAETVIVRTSSGEERSLVAREAIGLCHKIALCDLDAGMRVIKYGQCIGETSQPVAQGAWVHVHNLRSLRGRAPEATP